MPPASRARALQPFDELNEDKEQKAADDAD
jgi:hypothetical protein